MAWQPRSRQLTAIKVALFAACLVPLARLVWSVAAGDLGTNPIETITRATGWWTLFLLCVTLAVTPARRLSGANWLIKLRRMLGLFAFFYAALHFVAFVWFDHWFALGDMLKDVAKRPFITIGFTAFVLLLPLAATSTAAMQRRLDRNWQRLHRLVYAIAALGVLHFWWLVKADVARPAQFALALAALLGLRLAWKLRELRPHAGLSPASQLDR